MMSRMFGSSPKYDSNPQKQAQITQKAARHRQQSARASMQTQADTKTALKAQISQQLGYSPWHANYVLDAANEPHNNYHVNVLEGMEHLIYLKNRKYSPGSYNFLIKWGIKLQQYIEQFHQLYGKNPNYRLVINNLDTKFRAIYGKSYNRWDGSTVSGYH